MKKATALLLLAFLSCSSNDKTTTQKNDTDIKKPLSVNDSSSLKIGWEDPDTYIVAATGSNEAAAVNNAKHKILKDIVNIRVRKGSVYTDISKIETEFENPLKTGKVLEKTNTDGGIKIYYQIRDKGLKSKFER
ncbi:MAG: hypothetical protein MUD12_00750 [Spirochaetes bacterium]|jgi:hypothetical protein|nr:hypothetical protein [Spirochaetota bacterium]